MKLMPDFEWSIVALHIRDLLFAYALALPIGWDRERNARTAGLVKGEDLVPGTATAATLWLTGAIGISVATGRLEIALVLSAMTFITLRIMASAKELINPGGTKSAEALRGCSRIQR